jgi:hypothetical protein
MATEWRRYCASGQVELEDDTVIVHFEGGRSHRVEVREADDTLEFRAVVARAAAVKDVADLPLRIWRHNRASQLVSFRIDPQGRVCASGWVPRHGISAEEFLFVLHRVAAESDRLEFILTGRDVE